eukprot:NODE_5629_length_631_cov_22.575397_g5465_i0.p1 GENE.NODE_5629_length_631_cov_22.575397_g5465_i0~~NODE_5629_length_631_cov_22.575397_g5465_i0.p1  ORF type:complete len:184 (+),score=22.63 NODE_5629_length_631_cov_22.575397_g5465_i0:36-554(+)
MNHEHARVSQNGRVFSSLTDTWAFATVGPPIHRGTFALSLLVVRLQDGIDGYLGIVDANHPTVHERSDCFACFGTPGGLAEGSIGRTRAIPESERVADGAIVLLQIDTGTQTVALTVDGELTAVRKVANTPLPWVAIVGLHYAGSEVQLLESYDKIMITDTGSEEFWSDCSN